MFLLGVSRLRCTHMIGISANSPYHDGKGGDAREERKEERGGGRLTA